MKKLAVVLVALVFAVLLGVPAGAYTVGQTPPSGMASGGPYILLNIGGTFGYVYPTEAQINMLGIGSGDTLAVNLSTVGVPSRPGTGFLGTRLYTMAFYTAPSGDADMSVLAVYLVYSSYSNSGIRYPVSVRWAWLQGDTNYFNNNAPALIAGSPVVVDTNIPMFSPKNSDLSMKSPVGVLLLVLGSLYAAHFLFEILGMIGRYRKSAGSY